MTLKTPAYWREWGSGNTRKALLLHCGNAHSGAWKGLAPLLEDRLHLVATDHPGHGRSPDLEKGRDLHDVATEYARLALPETGRADLIGHSFGGTVALRLALENPERVRSLTLIEPVLFSSLLGTPEWDVSFARAAPLQDLINIGQREDAARRFTGLWGNGSAWEDLPETQRSYITGHVHLIIASWPAIYDDRPGLMTPGRPESLRCPVQIIRGAETQVDIAQIHARLEQRLGVADQVIEGAGHMVPITHPIEVAAKVRAFLKSSG